MVTSGKSTKQKIVKLMATAWESKIINSGEGKSNYCFRCVKSKVGAQAERARKTDSVKTKTKSGNNNAQKAR